MLKLTYIGVGGFKSIKDLQRLELRPVNVLIGANGSGKSNLVSFFQLLRAISEFRLGDFVGRAGGADTLLYYGSKQTPSMWGSLYFEGKTGEGSYFFQLAATATDSLVFSPESITYPMTKNSDARPIDLGSGHKDTALLAEANQNQYSDVHDLLAGIQTFHFHDTSETAPVRKHCYIEDGQYLRSDAGNLAAFLYRLQQQQRAYYARIVKTIRQVAPFFEDFALG